MTSHIVKAAVCRSFGKPLEIESVRLAGPGPGEVRVAIKACAICHSDVFFIDGAWGGELPAVYGHEAAGVIVELGPGVADLSVGDHVVVTLIRSCGSCRYCACGEEVLCETSFPLDRKGPLADEAGQPVKQGLRTAAFAEQVVVDRSQVAAVSRSLPFELAALMACGVLTGFGAVVNTAKVNKGASAVIIGSGGVGLNSVQGCAVSGAYPIVAVDISDEKLKAARTFGATHTVNSKSEDLLATVKALTQGRGADYVFVTAGVPGLVEQAFSLLSRGGTLVLVGMPPNGVTATFDPSTVANDSNVVLGSKMGSARIGQDVPRLEELYDKKLLKLNELVSGRYRLEEINEALDSARRGTAIRNVIVF